MDSGLLPMRLALLLVLAIIALPSHAQDYRFKQYRVEQGLPSDVLKAVAQDDKGFIWVATDDGLAQYNGIEFTTYKRAFHSQYIKGFLTTRDNRLLAIGDLDLVEIVNELDTVIFKTLIRGARNPSDSTIWYPKSIYEDRHGSIWLGEPQSALRYNGKDIKRYDFGTQHRSPVFIRSISFFEDSKNNLYAVTYMGTAFKYESSTDSFTPLDVKLPENVSHAFTLGDTVYLATGNGILQGYLHNHTLTQLKLVVPVSNISHVALLPNGTVFASSYEDYNYLVSLKDFTYQQLPYLFNGSNTSYVSQEGDLWVSTDKGIVLVQKNSFIVPDEYSRAHFIESIAHDPERDYLFYCTKETLVELQPNGDNWKRNVIYNEKSAYFQSLQVGKRGLWASSVSQVMLFEKSKLKRTWDFSEEGNFIHDIFLDTKENLWVSQAGNRRITLITDSLTLHHYPVPVLPQSEINLVREGHHGMYVAASGVNGYLFFKAHDSVRFKNISLPVSFPIEGDFNIHEMAIQQGTIWIASTEGLLRFDYKTIQRVPLGDTFTNFPVSTVEILDQENILFSNSYGLFRYNILSGEYWLYDESSGLPSNTITNQGIFVDSQKRLWIGTSFGLALSKQSVFENKPTLKPFCVSAVVNGISTSFSRGIQAPHGAFITLQFSPITFPENKINLQWKFKNDSTWQTLKGNELNLAQLKAGNYVLHVRAKNNTGLSWSEPTVLTLSIARPFWEHAEFVMLILCGILVIAWLSYVVSAGIMHKRKQFLENLINKRTEELQKANDELTVRNNELDRFVYSASHDLSAPLKSILGLITVARLDEPTENHKEYLSRMERSVLKLEDFIKDVVSYSRNTRMPVKFERIDFKELARSVLQDLQYSPNFTKIDFIIEDHTGESFYSDATRLRIILNNLNSNAIKFHVFHDSKKPFVTITLHRETLYYRLCIEDNGNGIDKPHLTKIFDMFYRASEEVQGSGLGLYILKETVTKIGGTVSVNSVVENGTTFTVMLPITNTAEVS